MNVNNKIFREVVLYLSIAIVSLGGAYFFVQSKNLDFAVSYGDFSEYGVSDSTPLVVYASRNCEACQKLRYYLETNKIDYVLHEYETDESSFVLLIKNNINGVPVIFINDTMIRGFNESLTRDMLIENELLKPL